MKEHLSMKETLYISVMLFGLFFGAGNLIFPVYLGHMAGGNVWRAAAGFLITGVGLPLLGVAALGVSRSGGLLELSSRVGEKYGYFFTCALYMTIGPLFAIPRCATVSFTVGAAPLLGADGGALPLAAFSLCFFAAVLAFSLNPGKILTWVGKVLTPVFLIFLGVMMAAALASPSCEIGSVAPQQAYASGAFAKGFIEGYNTMDALASLAFGIVVINVIRGLGVESPRAIAANTVKAGVLSCLIMAAIYLAISIVGAQSSGLYESCSNGGEILAIVARSYFGETGALILAGTVTFACLKTAVGLVTSCSESFSAMFTHGRAYRRWSVFFTLLSFLIANLGLDAIIAYAVPVLMFLYPLAITLILLGLFGNLFAHDRTVYGSVTAFTLAAALFDLIKALPQEAVSALSLGGAVEAAGSVLPLYDAGMGWICPALAGLAVGLAIRRTRRAGESRV